MKLPLFYGEKSLIISVHGHQLYFKGGKCLKIYLFPKMALEEGILFALLREGQKGKRRGLFFWSENTGKFEKTRRRKVSFFSKIKASSSPRKLEEINKK